MSEYVGEDTAQVSSETALAREFIASRLPANGLNISPYDAVVALRDDHLVRDGEHSDQKGRAETALAFGFGAEWEHESIPESNGNGNQRSCILGEFVSYSPNDTEGDIEVVEAVLDEASQARVAVNGAAMMVGRGLVEELSDLLEPSELGADIYNPYKPSTVMRLVQGLHRDPNPAPDDLVYKLYPMGHGPLIVTPDPERIVTIAERTAKKAKVIGRITADRIIRVKSFGINQPGETLTYEL